MNKQTTTSVSCSFKSIPTYARFQWLNDKKVIRVLEYFLKPSKKGRKGYNKVWMFRWLIYKQLMRCTYRDLESITNIDYSTFIKFRGRLIQKRWFTHIWKHLITNIISKQKKKLLLIVDSSFVESYSRKKEQGVEYNGYKKKKGFKLHQIIDYHTRLPLLQYATAGARADVIWGRNLVRAGPKS